MNDESSSAQQTWPPVVAGQDDVFGFEFDFNDISSIDIDFQAIDEQQQQQLQNEGQHQAQNHQHVSGGGGGQGTRMDNASSNTSMLGQGGMRENHLHGGGVVNMPGAFVGGQAGKESLMSLERLQQHQRYFAQQQNNYQRQGIVPPTPNSMDMHGMASTSTAGMNPAQLAQARAIWEMHQRKHSGGGDSMVFTPLVSPAVTPIDTSFRMPEYAVPAVSPVDMDIDSPVQHPASSKSKTSSKRKTSQAKPASRAIRQSPAMKPQQRPKKGSTTAIPARDIADIMEGFTDARTSSPGRAVHGNLALPLSQTSSETGSISPEPLSEVLMPPPAARPSTAGRSPNMFAQDAAGQNSMPPLLPFVFPGNQKENPATPASLMQMQKGQAAPPDMQHAHNALQQHQLQQFRELPTSNPRLVQTALSPGVGDLTLPDAAIPFKSSNKASQNRKPDLSVDTDVLGDDQTTPTLNARGSGAGHRSAPLSAVQTPVPMSPANLVATRSGGGGSGGTSAVASPSTRTNFPAGNGPPAKGAGVKGKKRNSSSHPSPALRPKISPSIKPLLPEGAKLLPDASAFLKSNYQNILDGTPIPGVSYPEALSENLTSKRTSHKIAEQGRRNRINNALQEIAALLPPLPVSPPSGANGKDTGTDGSVSAKDGGVSVKSKGKEKGATASGAGGGGNAATSSSKASTVEMAIEYIKALQCELADVKGRLTEAERKLGEREGSEGNEDTAATANGKGASKDNNSEDKIHTNHTLAYDGEQKDSGNSKAANVTDEDETGDKEADARSKEDSTAVTDSSSEEESKADDSMSVEDV